MRFLSQFFDSNDRELSRIQPLIDEANELETEYEGLDDTEIRDRIDAIREELLETAAPEEPSDDELTHPDLERRRDLVKARRKRDQERLQRALDDVAAEVFAIGREAMKRTMGMRQYDVQLMGAYALHQGRIAEMRTGEGKTFIPTLAAVLNGLTGRGAHVVTVNDYLARRDAQWMGPAYHFLGLSVGVITHDTSFLYEPGFPTTDERLVNLRPVTRREAYAADITYGTNNEFGFDYLRDNMVDQLDARVQRERSFAIVDEVDNILIDEARTPLIISGQAEESADLYFTFARLVPKLKERPEGDEEGGDYFLDLKDKAVSPTEDGIDKIEKLLGIDNLYDADPRLARHFDSALKAHALYKRDRDYIVEGQEIVIVDEFTGRKMPGRRWSEGLHQAIEAKEGLRVQRESRTLATITFQNYFRLYDKLAGMTGTAMTEAEEFHKIYNLEVVAIPTHRPMIRDDYADLVFRNEASKFNALIDEIEEMTNAGPPGPRGHGVGREVRGPVHAAQAARDQARHAERQVPREGGGHRRAGGPQRRGGHRHQHGRPRHRHQAGRRPGGSRIGHAPQAGAQPGRGGQGDLRRGARAGQAGHRRGPREGRRGGRAPHHRHRAPREPPDRQPAPRPRRPPGRPGLVAVLPVARRRPDEALRVGARGRAHGAAGPRGRHGDRVAAGVAHHRERPDPRRGLQLRHPQARRRVRRRHQQAARDDLRRARQGAPQRGPDRDRPGVPGRRGRGDGRPVPGQPVADRVEPRGAVGRAARDGPRWRRHQRGGPRRGRRLARALVEHMRELVDASLEARVQEHGEEVWSQVERFVLLRTIDSLWVEHLTELDDMRRGIGLRGYAQQDPLNEFRKEAYRLYEELRDLIRRQVATTIFRVSVKRDAPASPSGTVPLPGPGQPARPGLPGQQHTHADGSVHDGPPHAETPGNGSGPGGSAAAAQAARAPLAAGQAALRQPAADASAVRGLPADPMASRPRDAR